MQQAVFAAEYYPGRKGRPATPDITGIIGGRRTPVFSTTVANKREARQIAEDFGVQPWNF